MRAFLFAGRPLFRGLILLVLLACDDPVALPDPDAVAMVSVAPTAATLVPGQQLQLTGRALDRSRNPLPDVPVTWSSSDPSVATVSAEGLVQPLLAGTAEIRARAEGFDARSRITIAEGGVVGPAGGTVSAFGGIVTLDVPESAVASPLVVQVAEPVGPPLDPSAAGGGFAVRFTGTLAAPATLIIGYQPESGPAGVPESVFGLRRLDVNIWRPVDGSVSDPASDRISAPITSPGTYGVGRIPPATPCTAAEHRQFDFWLGRWGVVPTGSPPGTREAASFITAEPGGCAILEDFRDLDVRGESISLYDPGSGQWSQTFVDNTGTRLVFVGGLVGDAMLLTEPDNASRITWSVIGSEVRQLGEASADAGTSWGPAFDLTYVRR